MAAEVVTATAPGGAAVETGQDPPAAETDRKANPASLRRRLGFGLVVLSCLLYGCLLFVPSAPLSTAGKVALSSLLVISGEASFWIGGFILGRDVVARWRGALDPRRWRRWVRRRG